MNFVELLFRWFHIFAAIALAGGIFFMRFAFVPGLYSLPEDQRDNVRNAFRGGWAKIVMISTTFLLVSGLYNFIVNVKTYQFLASPESTESSPVYHMLFLVKFLGGMGIFWLAAVLSGKSSTAQKFRKKEASWTNLAFVLTVIVVGTGSYMKVIPRVFKTPSAIEQSQELDIELPTTDLEE